MHEASVARELLRICRAEVDARGGGRLRSVQVTVGELSSIEPQLLQFAWAAVTEAEPEAGATIETDWRRAHQRCPNCGDIIGHANGGWMRWCPQCDWPLTIEGGDELEITRIRYETETVDAVS